MPSLYLTSHRLLRLCILLCTACSSMLSVRRISCLSLYMFGFAKRPSSAEKCDSNSSGDNWMPQIGHELWPVADCCIGFFGPIPGERERKNVQLFLRAASTRSIIIFSSIFRPLNMISFATKNLAGQLMQFWVKISTAVRRWRGFELFKNWICKYFSPPFIALRHKFLL